MYKNVHANPEISQKLQTLMSFYVDTREILKVRRCNKYRFVPQGGTFPTETIMLVVREALVCEKLIP